HGAFIAYVANQLAGINIRYTYNVLFLKIILYRFIGLFTAVGNVIVFANKAGNLYLSRFHFVGINAIVTNVRVCGHHYLPKVGWVGKYFLVTGHAGVKANFARSGAYFACGFTIKSGSVGQ